MFHKSLFDLQVANLVAPLVGIQQTVEADRSAGEDELPHFNVGLNGARSTQTDQREPVSYTHLDVYKRQIHLSPLDQTTNDRRTHLLGIDILFLDLRHTEAELVTP